MQQQWDHRFNAHIGNAVIRPKSHRKVWWTCDQWPDGHLHSWQTTVADRTKGRGCSQSSGRKVCKHICLATKAPLVAAQWDCEANAGSPSSVVAQSRRMVGWHCDVCGHKWDASLHARVSKKRSGCPQCAADANRRKKKAKQPSFAECQHPLLAEWDQSHNAAQGNFPDDTTLQSAKKIFWLCTKCPKAQEHSWAAEPSSRTGRQITGCPCCAGKVACRCNSLQTLYPEIAAEWDESKNNGQPSDRSACSQHLTSWSNPQRGSWQQSIQSRTRTLRSRSIAKHFQQDNRFASAT